MGFSDNKQTIIDSEIVANMKANIPNAAFCRPVSR